MNNNKHILYMINVTQSTMWKIDEFKSLTNGFFGFFVDMWHLTCFFALKATECDILMR